MLGITCDKIRFIPALKCVALLLLVSVSAYAYHPPVQLLDKEGEFIDPINGENENLPFSTEQTCGLCHDYETITEGYHFQAGWNTISDTFGVALGKPWILSDGMMGKWCVTSFRQMSRKENNHPGEIDLTPFEFVGEASYTPDGPTCGSCHAGGGGLQYDRDGERYDEMLIDDPDLRESLDGDYYQSQWDKSGVVEADCFICHWENYYFEERVSQFRKLNFQWAVVAAAGIGLVEGDVSYDHEPSVTYNKRFFNSDGTLVFNPTWPPSDKNCMFCHERSDVKKRGFTWNDLHNPDVHQAQGVSCTHCHTAGEDHQFAKGDVLQSTVADDLDNTMKSCEDCHLEGLLGATIPAHFSVRPSHIERIACEGCHIPKLHRSAISGIDATTGELHYIANPPTAEGFGELASWEPIYERRENEKIYPFNNMLTIWWANLDSDSIIYPLFAREHAAAWELYADQVEDDNGDGVPEINRDDEILAGLKAFTGALEDNVRFSQVHPVFIKGGKGYHLNSDGNLAVLDMEVKCDISYSINHNITKRALGGDGCGDCHKASANFFKGQRVIDLYGPDGEVQTRSIGRYLGCNPISFAISSFHQEILSPVVSILMILTVFFVTIHYHSLGPKRVQFVPDSGEIQRFTLFERGLHLFRLLSFIILAITGLILAFNWHQWQQLLFSTPNQLLWVHIISGIVFIITTLVGTQMWFKDALFASYDKDWVKRIGGYLGYKGEVPAGRFNAGQKMFYWYSTIFGLVMSVTGLILVFKYSFSISTICVTSTVHNLFGFVLIAGVLAHAYLGTIANPGTWRVLVDGHVTREWAKHHHPNWFRKIIGQKEPTNEEGNDQSK